jgi:PAS domain S-box-containing protein
MAETQRNELSRLAAYAVAAAMASGALLLRGMLPLGPGLGIYPLALAMVVLSAWYGGRGPGWVAALLSLVGARYFFIEPKHSLAVQAPGTYVGLLLFVGTAILLIEFSMARRRSQHALAESEGRFRLMAEHIPEVLWIEALEPHRLLYASPSFERVWGRPVADVYREPDLWQQAIHPEDRQRIGAMYASWLDDGADDRFDCEYRIVRPDGATRWIHDRGVLIRDARGKAFRASGIAEDITERKNIEERMRTSEEHWKQVFENNPTMYFVVDAAGTILSVNLFGADQLGYRVEELVGQQVSDIFHGPDRERASRHLASCLQRPGQSLSWELRKVRKDGTVIWVRETARAVTGLDQSPIVLVACEDITAAKVAAEELRYQTQLLASITDNMKSMIHMIDSDGRTVYVNPATERLTGFRANELIGRSLHEKLHHSHPDGRPYPESQCPLFRSIGSMKPTQVEEMLVRKDGTFFPVFCSATPIVHDGVSRGLIVELQDMTERNKAQEALGRMQAELAHVTRVTTIGELVASIAHDVNQPLAAIVTNANACLRWLVGKQPNLDEARQAAEAIVRDGARAGEIISGIRALLRKAPSRKDPIDVNDAIAEVVALTRAEAQRRRVKLDMQLSRNLPAVLGDRVLLQQVILNLILNGVESAGAVPDGPRELMVSSEAADGVLVTIRDTGIGLDKADVGRLFDAFYTTKQGGLGMGLAISRSIIESHRGRIWATPNEPRGAVFRFTVPAAARA